MGNRQWIGSLGVGIMMVLLSLFGIAAETQRNAFSERVSIDTVKIEKVQLDTGTLFDAAIDHIKDYEGFRSNVYYDTDGSKTIGYGHHLKKGENFTQISEEFATKLLIRDLTKRIKYVEETTELSSNKSLALGMFAFNVGNGNLNRAIRNGLLKDIQRLKLYCNYTTKIDGVKITKQSKKLLERREFEIYIYTHDVQ